jgi:hypothetical protein
MAAAHYSQKWLNLSNPWTKSLHEYTGHAPKINVPLNPEAIDPFYRAYMCDNDLGFDIAGTNALQEREYFAQHDLSGMLGDLLDLTGFSEQDFSDSLPISHPYFTDLLPPYEPATLHDRTRVSDMMPSGSRLEAVPHRPTTRALADAAEALHKHPPHVDTAFNSPAVPTRAQQLLAATPSPSKKPSGAVRFLETQGITKADLPHGIAPMTFINSDADLLRGYKRFMKQKK